MVCLSLFGSMLADVAFAKFRPHAMMVNTLSWQPNAPTEQVLGYRIYRSDCLSLPTLLADVSDTNYQDAVPYRDHQACYEVTAYNAAGESAHSQRVMKTW
jgi:fibronectin type 3 domain-containing protein